MTSLMQLQAVKENLLFWCMHVLRRAIVIFDPGKPCTDNKPEQAANFLLDTD